MKKLLFGLIAMVMFTSASFGQIVEPTSKITTSVSLTSKFHGVITYLESKDYYRAGMTKDEFVKNAMVGVKDQKLIEIFRPYMETIYTFHTQKLTADNVYDKIRGDEFSKVVNQLRIYQKETGNSATAERINWLNALRKFIDWVDDTFNQDPKQP